jgi:hypothetical protein
MVTRFVLFSVVSIAFGTGSTVADEAATPAPSASHQLRNHAHVKRTKSDAEPMRDGMEGIDFSRPNESPLASKSQKSLHTPVARSAPLEPQGGVSFDLKWRATNDKADPYDAVRHDSGPNGPGDAVQGGLKLGF